MSLPGRCKLLGRCVAKIENGFEMSIGKKYFYAILMRR
jgi:hypothetical protein